MDTLNSDSLCLQDLVSSVSASRASSTPSTPNNHLTLASCASPNNASPPNMLSDGLQGNAGSVVPHPADAHSSHHQLAAMQYAIHSSVSVNSSQAHSRSLSAQSVHYPSAHHVSSLFTSIPTPSASSISGTPPHHHFYNHHHPTHFQSSTSLNDHNITSKYSPHLDSTSPSNSICHQSVSSCSSSLEDCKKLKSGEHILVIAYTRLTAKDR